VDAVTDPELFKELLRTPASIRLDGPRKSRIAHYLIGAATTLEDGEE
jgi:hypothetical protein